MDPRERLILALDVDNAYQAIQLTAGLANHVGAFKVGLELVNAAGPGIFEKLRETGAGRIFYDAKFHDIPHTVGRAAKAAARHDLWMLNVHAAGGSRMISSAANALRETVSAPGGGSIPILLGVTLLTSLSADELRDELGISLDPTAYVVKMAKMVKASGGQGVVASPHEIEAIRHACGKEFVIVTPGIRPAGGESGDQRRTMTPGEAVKLGADYLVVGRPITAAPDPVEAARRILEEIS